MIPDYLLCDVCANITKLPTLYIHEDRQMDAAGSMEDIFYNCDLCGECAYEVLRRLRPNLGNEVIQIIRSMRNG